MYKRLYLIFYLYSISGLWADVHWKGFTQACFWQRTIFQNYLKWLFILKNKLNHDLVGLSLAPTSYKFPKRDYKMFFIQSILTQLRVQLKAMLLLLLTLKISFLNTFMKCRYFCNMQIQIYSLIEQKYCACM